MLIFFSLLQLHTCLSLMLKIHKQQCVRKLYKSGKPKMGLSSLQTKADTADGHPACFSLQFVLEVCLTGLWKEGALFIPEVFILRDRSSSSICRLPKEDVWVMTKGRDRAWDWAGAVLLRHQDVLLVLFPARAPVEIGWTAVSSHLYTLSAFIKPKALMNQTFHEK